MFPGPLSHASLLYNKEYPKNCQKPFIKFLPDESSIFGWVAHIIDIILTIGVMMSVDVGAGDKVIVHVKDIGQQGLGGLLFKVKLLHLVLHHDGLPGDLLPWSSHS